MSSLTEKYRPTRGPQPVARRGYQCIRERRCFGRIERAGASFLERLANYNAQIDRRSRIEFRRQTGQLVESNRALIIGARVPGGGEGVTQSLESVVATQFSVATLSEMMDRSSELA